MPTLDFSILAATSEFQRAPFSISDDIHGSTAWITCTIHLEKVSATALLLLPDQLRKTCILISQVNNYAVRYEEQCLYDLHA